MGAVEARFVMMDQTSFQCVSIAVCRCVRILRRAGWWITTDWLMGAFKNNQTRKVVFLHEIALSHYDIAPHEVMEVRADIIGVTKDAGYSELG